MLKLTVSVCIEALKEANWKVLVDIENVFDWVKMIQSTKNTGDIQHGIGAEQ